MQARTGRIIGIILTWCFFANAMSDVGAGNPELGFDAGYVFLGSGDLETGVDAGARIGLRAGIHITDHFEIEGQYSYAKSRGDCGLFSCDDVETTLRTFFINALFNFKPIEENEDGSMSPYVLVGAGESTLEFGGDVSMEDSSPAYQAGAGLRLHVRRLGVRGELLLIGDDTFDDRSLHWSLGLGVTVALGSID